MKKVISSEDKPIKMWLDDIEDGALDQAKNLANLPFVFKHVAIMPDSHLGYGMPIGGVLATEGVVLPNCVGVDIGCFTGDTEVISLDGAMYSMKYMAESKKQFCVYSCTEKRRIVARYAIATKTRSNANLLSVTLDNEETVNCTPDHKFMMRDGSYKEAKELQENDSLMPLYTQEDKEGYVRVMQPNSEKWQRAHWMVARSGLLGGIPSYDNDRPIIHHKKFQEENGLRDNHPKSLEFMASREHSRFHREIGTSFKELNSDPKFQAKRQAAMERRKKDPKKLQQMKDVGTDNITKYMNENKEEFLEKVSENGRRGSEYLRKYNVSDKGRKKSSEVAHMIHTCPECGEKCEGGLGLYNHMQTKHPVPVSCESCEREFKNQIGLSAHRRHYPINHKVISVEKIDKKEDVYCLQIQDLDGHENPHNFALASGVFVHNCGMGSLKTNIVVDKLGTKKLKAIMGEIRKSVPVGFEWHKERQNEDLMPNLGEDYVMLIVPQEYNKARKQLGTLGGGNHFIEIQEGSDGFIWLMIHSGSRNLGKKVADHYNKKAVELNEQWRSSVPKKHELAFLPIETYEAKLYMTEMQYCVDFALANRKHMMENVKKAVKNNHPPVKFETFINIAHNYAAWENHFGKNVIVHRKGATKAYEGEYGIIPGSQGTKSYIVKGKGNPDSFKSCSHGAGRKMGRKQAQRTLDLQEEIKKLDDQGIVHGIRNEKDLDEASGAYKDINVVMENQKDLVDIEVELKPLAVIKG